MVKLAARPVAPAKAPIRSNKGRKPDTTTYEGGAGYSREAKSELFLLAVTNMVSEDTFYEKAKDRDQRFMKLVRQVALEDPDWVARFVPYLRNVMNMRSASIVMAAELLHAKLTQPVAASSVRNRDIIASAIVRADEPAEMLGYWMSEYGRNLPMPLKRGVADAVSRLYNERSLIKYDGGEHPIRFGDVIDLVHPEPKAPWQGALFRYALDSRHKRDIVLPWAEESPYASLTTLGGNRAAMMMAQEDFRAMFSADFVEKNGLTWEQASSKYGKLDARFWEAMIPSMGIFALVRNLRNFDEAKISEDAANKVRLKLLDAETIAKSRMFPLRFYTAYQANKSLTYARELEVAIQLSLANVPVLKGKTLVLVDVSGSMDVSMSQRGDAKRLDVASIFGAALALRAEHASLGSFSNDVAMLDWPPSSSALRLAEAIVASQPHQGTYLWGAVRTAFDGHDRIIILTDEQAHDTAPADWDPDLPIYVFNLAGYRAGTMPSGRKNRYVFGGLSDAGFTMLELLERGHDQDWPF